MEGALGREAYPATQSLQLLAHEHCCFGSLGLCRFVPWTARHGEAEPCPELQGGDRGISELGAGRRV